MNPKQKRTWGTILRALGVLLLTCDAALMIFRFKPAAQFASGAILIAGCVPIWFGTILIWQARKEENRK